MTKGCPSGETITAMLGEVRRRSRWPPSHNRDSGRFVAGSGGDHRKSEPILLGCLLGRDPYPEFGLNEDGLSLAFRSSSSIRHIALTKASTSSEPVSEPSHSFLHTGVRQNPGR